MNVGLATLAGLAVWGIWFRCVSDPVGTGDILIKEGNDASLQNHIGRLLILLIHGWLEMCKNRKGNSGRFERRA
jgi:hypothetical protein